MKSLIIQPAHVRGLGNILDNEDNIQGLHCRVEAQDSPVEFDDLQLKAYYMGTGTNLTIRFIVDTVSILPEGTVHVDVKVTDDEDNPVSGVDLYVYESEELISQMETDETGYGVEDEAYGFNFTSEDVGKHTLKCIIPRQDLYFESRNELVINVLAETTLTLTIDPEDIDTLNDTITLYATLVNEEEDPVVGEIITFYDGTTLLGWGMTNDLGVATLIVSIDSIQDLGLVPTIGIEWVSTGDNPNNHTEDGSLYVSAEVSGSGVNGLPLTILANNSVIFEGVTDSTGHADILNTNLSENSVITVITQPTSILNATTKQYRLGESELLPTETSLSLGSNSIYVNGSTTATATVSSDSEGVEGLTVTFYDGTTALGSSTTNSSGVATYTISGLSAGSHSITAVASGDTTYSGSTSSAASLSVSKLSTSTSLSASGNNVLVGTSVTLTATVTSSSTPVEGLTVTFKDGNNTLGTGTTNSSGVATYTTSSLSVATHSLTAVVTETGTYATSTSSSASVVVYDHSYSLAFSQASYAATGGSATLSVTLLDNNVAVSGATVSVAGSDSSLYSGITNSSGIATITVENISSETTFTASYGNVSDTCTVTVQSYLFRDGGVTGDYNSNYVDTGTGIVATVGSTGTNISCTANADRYRKANVLLSGDFKVTVTYTQTTNNGCSFALLNSSNTKQYSLEFGWSNMKDWDNNGTQLISNLKAVDDSPLTYERVGSTLTVKCNGTQLLTRTITTSDVYFAWKTHKSGGRNFTFRDLTIEGL